MKVTNNNMLVLALLVTAVTFLTTTPVSAVPITWYLRNVVFNDGTTATGSFDFDADTETYSNIDITTGNGEYGDPFVSTLLGASRLRTVPKNISSTDDLRNQPFLQFLFDAVLTGSGGTVMILRRTFSYEGTCRDAACNGRDVSRRIAPGGSVTTDAPPTPWPTTQAPSSAPSQAPSTPLPPPQAPFAPSRAIHCPAI